MLTLEKKKNKQMVLRITLANSFRLCRTAGGISKVSKGGGRKVEALPTEGEASQQSIKQS